LNPTKYAALITPCPSTACTSLINKYVLGVGPNPDPRTIRGVLPASPVAFVDGTQQNLATTQTSGIDLQTSYNLPTDELGNFDFGLAGTYVAEYNQSVTPGAPITNELNRIGFPLRLRFRGNLTWQKDAWSAALFVNYTTGYQNDTATPVQNVSPYTTVDAHIGYDLTGLFGFDELKDSRISLEFTNLFDADPPYVNTIPTPNGGGGYDPSAASPLGRLIAVSLEKKF
jgi:iron complex outermembrane receptor protein